VTARPVMVVGGGLAGTEVALSLASANVPVLLVEMRPETRTGAHRSGALSELVCSNSLKSVDPGTAHGLLKEELAKMGSSVLDAAMECRIPGGGALVVDRERFSERLTRQVEGDPRITLVRERIDRIPENRPLVLATGPLTHPALALALEEAIGSDRLSFYDAISPVVEAASLDFGPLFRGDRWGEPGVGDYVNVPLDREQYEALCADLLAGERVPPHEGVEDRPEVLRAFEACQPVESLAETGPETLAFGPLRPVGLVDPRTGKIPCAVLQLRAENREETAYNLVGFQTKLKYSEQDRIFRKLPGFSGAVFLRYGSLHRNTFLDAPRVLGPDLSLLALAGVYPTGQMMGVEGYTESVALGRLTALLLTPGPPVSLPPPTSALGALVRALVPAAYREEGVPPGPEETGRFSPVNLHFGLFPPLSGRVRGGKAERRKAQVVRAREAFDRWWESVRHRG